MWDLSSQGSNPSPVHWKHGVLTTGLPGKSLIFFLMQLILCCTFLCRDHVYTNHRQSFLLSIFVLTFILYWSIVDLQCCVSFRCIAKMLQLYICRFFLKFFSHLGYYGLLSRVPCAIQQVLVGYPFKYACILSRFSCDWLFVTPWTAACQALCSWDSPGKNTGVGCHAFLQGIFLTQRPNLRLLRLLLR